MEIRLDSHGEQLIRKQLRSGRYQSPEQVVLSALEALNQDDDAMAQSDQRRRAVHEMLEFAGKHGFTLGEGLQIRDLIREGQKY